MSGNFMVTSVIYVISVHGVGYLIGGRHLILKFRKIAPFIYRFKILCKTINLEQFL